MRGIYSTKDTFVTRTLQAGVKVAWLEAQTGVAYATLKRHYGKWITPEGTSELQRFAALEPTLFGARRGTELPPALPPEPFPDQMSALPRDLGNVVAVVPIERLHRVLAEWDTVAVQDPEARERPHVRHRVGWEERRRWHAATGPTRGEARAR